MAYGNPEYVTSDCNDPVSVLNTILALAPRSARGTETESSLGLTLQQPSFFAEPGASVVRELPGESFTGRLAGSAVGDDRTGASVDPQIDFWHIRVAVTSPTQSGLSGSRLVRFLDCVASAVASVSAHVPSPQGPHALKSVKHSGMLQPVIASHGPVSLTSAVVWALHSVEVGPDRNCAIFRVRVRLPSVPHVTVHSLHATHALISHFEEHFMSTHGAESVFGTCTHVCGGRVLTTVRVRLPATVHFDRMASPAHTENYQNAPRDAVATASTVVVVVCAQRPR